MTKSRIYNILIFLVLGIAIFGTFPLVMNEYEVGNLCPTIVGIPACYIVLTCFIVGLVSHALRRYSIYFVFIGIVAIIAVIGTVGDLTGVMKCPRTDSGIPMCYISLTICTTLLVAQYFHLNKSFKK